MYGWCNFTGLHHPLRLSGNLYLCSSVQGDTFIVICVWQVYDADSVVVNLNLLFSVPAALIGSVEKYFVNQIVQHFSRKLLRIGVLSHIGK